MSKIDKVKYFPNQGDKYVAIRCPVCNLKRTVRADEDLGCGNGCVQSEIEVPETEVEEAPIHLGDLKGDK